MRLFIPRKQNMTGSAIASSMGPSTGGPSFPAVDKDHLEKSLRENFLAVERWANSQLASAAMGQTSAHPLNSTGGHVTAFASGPWTVIWDEFALANTSGDSIRIPESGVYVASANAVVSPAVAPTTNVTGPSEAIIGFIPSSTLINGGLTSYQTDHGLIDATTSTLAGNASAFFITSFPFLARGAGSMSMVYGITGTTAAEGLVNQFAIYRLGNIPSKNQ